MLMVKHLCRYLLGLPVLATEVKKPDGSGILEGIVDSDWQGCQDTRKSTSGYVLVWEGSVVSVGSATQSGVPSLSSAEAELKAAIYGEKEMMLAEKRGTACDSAEGGPLCLVGSPLQVHAEEEEDGVELPDLNLSITSAGSPGRPLPARGT